MITLAFMACISPAMAQYWSMGLRTGIGMYSMKDLDEFQELRRQESGLPLKTTESYPVSPNYRIELVYNSQRFISKAGFFYTFNSTGARSTVSDYSGRYDLDAIINGNQLGLTFEHLLDVKHYLGYGVYADGNFSWTRLRTLDFFQIVFPGNITYKYEYDFRAMGFSSEWGLYLQYTYGRLRARFNIGYLLDYSSGLHLAEDKNLWLVLDNEKLRPQWDGLRIGVQVDILFKGAPARVKRNE